MRRTLSKELVAVLLSQAPTLLEPVQGSPHTHTRLPCYVDFPNDPLIQQHHFNWTVVSPRPFVSIPLNTGRDQPNQHSRLKVMLTYKHIHTYTVVCMDLGMRPPVLGYMRTLT